MGTSRPYLQALCCNATAGDVMTRVFMLSIRSRDAKTAFEWIAEVIKSCALCRFMRVGFHARRHEGHWNGSEAIGLRNGRMRNAPGLALTGFRILLMISGLRYACRLEML
jgi:hypothetical protein